MIWIPLTIAATFLQVSRNALQRGLLPVAGPWGATLVRFLFGLPFTAMFIVMAKLATPEAQGHFSVQFLIACLIGAMAQMGATAALLVSMQRSSFAIGTAFQQSSLPFTALVGFFVFHDPISPAAWAGLLIATAGLIYLSWPRQMEGGRDWSPALLGLASGAAFAVSANAFRQAGLGFDPHFFVFSALVTVAVVQTIQTLVLIIVLLIFDPKALKGALGAWKSSLGAGFFGAGASALWFIALTLSPAGPVRAVGVLEMPVAALMGRRFFSERLSLSQIVAGTLTALGVVMAAIG
jgi:drug/metabolite transporter (DMT)-like permease